MIEVMLFSVTWLPAQHLEPGYEPWQPTPQLHHLTCNTSVRTLATLPELATCPCNCCQGRSSEITDKLGGSCLGIWLLAQEQNSFGVHMQAQAADCSPNCSQGAGLGGHLQGLPLHHPTILCSMGSSCLAPVASKVK